MDKNCRFFTNDQLLNVSCFFYSDLTSILTGCALWSYRYCQRDTFVKWKFGEWHLLLFRKCHTNGIIHANRLAILLLKVTFLYNRLALIIWYLLDIDLALFSLLLLWEIKSNKSWNTIFALKVLFYVHYIIQLFATFQCKFH